MVPPCHPAHHRSRWTDLARWRNRAKMQRRLFVWFGVSIVVTALVVMAVTSVLDNAPLVLTPVEFDLLASLAKARGRVKSREALLDEIRDRNYDVFDRSIDVHVSALRKKLGDDPKNPRFIKTLRAAGYMLKDPETDVDA